MYSFIKIDDEIKQNLSVINNFLCKALYLQALFLITCYFQWQALIINPLKFVLRPKFEPKTKKFGQGS